MSAPMNLPPLPAAIKRHEFNRGAPQISDAFVDAPLTDMTVASLQLDSNFVASKMPVQPQDRLGGLYYVYTAGHMSRLQMKKRAPMTAAEIGNFQWDTASFKLERRSLAWGIDNNILASMDAALNPDISAREFFKQQVALEMELDLKTAIWGNSIWGTNLSGVTSSETLPSNPTSGTTFLRWNAANSTPIEDVTAVIEQISIKNDGVRPNTIIVGRDVYNVLINHSTIIARFSNNGNGEGARSAAGPDRLAQLFNVDNFFVSSAVYNTAGDGVTASNALVLTNGMWIGNLYFGPPAPMVNTAFSRLTWRGRGGSQDGVAVKKYEPDNGRIDGTLYEVSNTYSHEIVVANAGAFMRQVLTA